MYQSTHNNVELVNYNHAITAIIFLFLGRIQYCNNVEQLTIQDILFHTIEEKVYKH